MATISGGHNTISALSWGDNISLKEKREMFLILVFSYVNVY